MPLAFESLSHGTIAFGFFNIESDMLLCDRYFFFADDFCAKIGQMAGHTAEPEYQTAWKIHRIDSFEEIGDLMGAIHGVRFTGFIGELYRRFPFPQQPADFKQNPEGNRTRSLVAEIISKYANTETVQITVDNKKQEAAFGRYHFNRFQFQELLKYVWRGGYPRWKDDIRPAYVLAMKEQIMANRKGIFESIQFDG
jgi:hypothetical protein